MNMDVREQSLAMNSDVRGWSSLAPSVAATASAFSYRESKGSMKFVLTFLDLHCAWKGLCDELAIVSVCPSSEPQIHRQSLAWRWSYGEKPLLPHSKHWFDLRCWCFIWVWMKLAALCIFKTPAVPYMLSLPCFLGKQTHMVSCLQAPHLSGNNFPFGNSCLSY